MPRPQKNEPLLPLPAEPDADKLPRYAERKQLAAIHRHYYGPISPRTLEKWPLPWRISNGRAVAPVGEFLHEAQRRFNAAPTVMGGHGRRPETPSSNVTTRTRNMSRPRTPGAGGPFWQQTSHTAAKPRRDVAFCDRRCATGALAAEDFGSGAITP